MADNQVGIDQMKRLLSAASVVLPKLIVTLKDGVQVADITTLMGDATFMQAVKNIQAAAPSVVTEAKDLSLEEGLELIQPVVVLLNEVIKAAKAS